MADLALKVEGLVELQRRLRSVESTLPRQLTKANKAAAEIVAAEARSRVPVVTGRAQRSIAARAQQRKASVKGGGARAPYYPWLDFGGRVGRNKSVSRPFLKSGRYIYPAIAAKRDEAISTYEAAVRDVLRSAGLT